MKKITLIIASLFFVIGAMAQTFVQPVTGRFYKIKGLHTTNPWLGAVVENGGIDVLATEAEAGIYLKTERGLKAVASNKYMGTGGNGSQISLVDAEADVTLESADNNMYYIKTGGRYLHNNQADYTREGGRDVTSQNKFGFVEVEPKVVADGVYTIKNVYNNRGAMAYGTWNSAEYFGLTEITLSGCTNNNLTVDPVSNKYWYVKTTDKGVYIYNIGKGCFLQERASEKATCATDIANGFTLVERTANNTNYISVMSGNYYLSYSCGWAPNSNYGSVRWLTSDEAAATLMTFTSVDATAYATEIAAADAKIAKFEAGITAKAALAEAIAQAEALLAEITIGDGVGEYSGGGYTKEELVSLLSSAKEFYNSIDAATPVETIEAYIEFVNGTMASYTLNMPEAGKYYRLKGNSGNYIDASSIYNNATAKIGQMSMKSADACNLAGTIFYLDENNKLLNYHTGTYITATREIANVGVGGNTWTISASTITGKYKIKSNDGNWLHDNSGNRADRCDQDPNGHSETHSWIIEEVEALPVTVTSAGWGTFYAPVEVAIPNGVKAYYLTADGVHNGYIKMTELTNKIIPAETAVILEGEGNHNFKITNNGYTTVVDNLFDGTVAATYITEDAYVLTLKDGEVCLGGVLLNQLDNTAFLNNSHKAYLPASAVPASAQGVSFYGFLWGDEETTAIENVEVVTEDVIYDLSGRRVETITAPGIYVVNGRKMLVK